MKSCQSWQRTPRDAAVRVEGGSSITDIGPVAGQELPEPYVPGSGARVPAELRLVLVGYVGVACGLFVGALACGAAVFLYFFTGYVFSFVDYADPYGGVVAGVILAVITYGTLPACIWGLWRALKTLKAGSRFSRLLRRPNDARTATVMASERGGRTLILDSNPRDGTGRVYQPLSEVRLALWLKAGMLMPGETVTFYAGTGGKSEMLISSAQRGRGFLGTVKSRSTVHPGLGPLDEKVSGATLVDWAAWAALTSFSSTGLRLGYDKPEVDAFREAIRDTFLGVGQPPVRAHDVRGKQFSSHRPGYDKTQVDAFLEAAGLRLAAMESTDRPEEPLVSGALLVAWAEWADSTTFSKRTWRSGYEAKEVDPFREAIRDAFLGEGQPPVRAHDVRGKQFALATDSPHDGYDPKQVDAFLDAAGIRLAAMESTDRPPEPLVSGTILTDGPSGQTQQDFQPPRWAEWAAWAEWADSTRFSTTPRKGGYDTAEVDAFRQEIRDTFLGESQPPVRADDVRGKRFRMARRGYDVVQVDAFFDEAEQRLAAITPNIEFTQPQPQPWPQQGMQPPDRSIDPDTSATDAPSTPTDGDIPGWTPPPWSPNAADTRPFWRRIATSWLIAGALVLLVGAAVGWYLYASQSATGKPEVAPAEPTQVHTEVATPDEIDESEDLNVDEINIDDSDHLRVGDCFDLKHPLADIEHVRKVPCTTEHDYELFYVGAMRKRSHPTLDAFADYVVEYCEPAFSRYIGKAVDDSDLDYDWLVPTEDAWRSGDRTVQCAAYDPNYSLLKGSVRGAHR